jgi:hypothetical protein
MAKAKARPMKKQVSKRTVTHGVILRGRARGLHGISFVA